MIIYIVVACYGGLVEEVKPFLDQKKAKQYEKEFKSQKDFNEENDTVAIYHEDLPLPAAIETRIQKHLAKEQKP